jgi:hypothetical protein
MCLMVSLTKGQTAFVANGNAPAQDVAIFAARIAPGGQGSLGEC